MQGHMMVIPATSLRQEDGKFEASLGILRDPVLKQRRRRKMKEREERCLYTYFVQQ